MNFGYARTHFNFVKLNLQKNQNTAFAQIQKCNCFFPKYSKGLLLMSVSTAQLVYEPFHIKLSVDLFDLPGKKVIFSYYVYINISWGI